VASQMNDGVDKTRATKPRVSAEVARNLQTGYAQRRMTKPSVRMRWRQRLRMNPFGSQFLINDPRIPTQVAT